LELLQSFLENSEAISTALGAMGSLLTALIGAFAGAYFAFSLENSRRKRAEKNLRIVEINKALFVLVDYLDELYQYENYHLLPSMKSQFPMLELKPTMPKQHLRPLINLNDISFLIDLEESHLLYEIKQEIDRFFTLIFRIDERSNLHVNVVFQRFSDHGIEYFEQLDEDKLVEILGANTYGVFRSHTDYIVKEVPRTIQSLKDVIYKTQRAMATRYKGIKLVNYDTKIEKST